MADLLPSSPDPSAGDGGEPLVVGVDSDDADDLLAALQSETARDLLAALYDDPATPSALAEELDTTIQTVRYHLERLSDAGLVEVADTIYSEKGREMKVYAPAAKPLVVVAGGDDESGVETALARLLGGLGVLGLSSLVVQRIFGGRNPVGDAIVDTDVEFDGQSAEVTTESENATGGGPNGEATETSASKATEQEAATETEAATTASDGAGTTVEEAGTTTAEQVTDATRTAAETTQAEATRTVETTQAAEATRTVTEEAATTTVAESATTAEPTTTVAEGTPTVTETTTTVADTTTAAAEAGGAALGSLPPGLVFFAGGLVVLLGLGAAWFLRGR